ncbi:hypothetical protein BU23DRAFT_516215 [Bimuria novae-zelandiae CBS 107.79]|uniref:Uncharacterized protein n=1 Tax=Bimuria novae-zelandiae CBS 107.79 TaxID=1447943 RepID=A0A6A5UXD3_9PLEO|nr:hypothetical protein BU23DRAFT_516215 [Bimuria novae-zelandiae CBS 107.79]
MGAIGNLIPLVILFAVVAGAGWVGYQIYLYSNELAERGVRKMEKKNVIFTKDGAKVAVKEVKAEDYTDRTQKAFVKTWNAAQADGSAPALNSRSSSYSDKKSSGGRSKTK